MGWAIGDRYPMASPFWTMTALKGPPHIGIHSLLGDFDSNLQGEVHAPIL